MSEEGKVKLFREKSLEAIESPESLNDYLRVTSPGVWLVMAAVIALLTGLILWGVFGRIETTASLAVTASEGQTVCYVPYDAAQRVMEKGVITVEGKEYALRRGNDYAVTVITGEMNPFVLLLGGLNTGDVTLTIPVEASLPDGVYEGTVVTESLQPISLLLQ